MKIPWRSIFMWIWILFSVGITIFVILFTIAVYVKKYYPDTGKPLLEWKCQHIAQINDWKDIFCPIYLGNYLGHENELNASVYIFQWKSGWYVSWYDYQKWEIWTFYPIDSEIWKLLSEKLVGKDAQAQKVGMSTISLKALFLGYIWNIGK